MVPLLTIASFERDGSRRGRAPCDEDPAQPIKAEVGSTDDMQLYVCPTSPEHPHTDLIQ
jgi:hypothetical protein